MQNSFFKWTALILTVFTINCFTWAYHQRTISSRYSQGQGVIVLDQKRGALYAPDDGKRETIWHSIEDHPQEDSKFKDATPPKGTQPAKNEYEEDGFVQEQSKDQVVDEFGIPIIKQSE